MKQQNKNIFNSNIMRDDRFDEAPSFEDTAETKRLEFQRKQAERLGGIAINPGHGRHIDYSRPVDALPVRTAEIPDR